MPTRSRALPLYPRVRLQYRDGSGHMRDSSKFFKPRQVLGSFPSPMSGRDWKFSCIQKPTSPL